MSEKRIHHYTSIASLASILRHRTIRFGRLDTLDDTEEAQEIGGFNFGRLLFASCWVEKEEEDIAQWAMYGNAMKGVRISLPRQPFACVPRISDPHSVMSEKSHQGYLIVPNQIDSAEEFLSRVSYVDDVAKEYSKRVTTPAPDSIKINGSGTALATFKNKAWEFQQEVRFILFAVRGPSGWKNQKEWAAMFADITKDADWMKQGPENKFIDRELAPDALDRGEIMLGPLANDADRLVVDALVATLAPGLTVRDSRLKGLIRHRQGG